MIYNSLVQCVLFWRAQTWTLQREKDNELLATGMDYL